MLATNLLESFKLRKGTTQEKNLNENVEVFWVTYALSLKKYLTLYRTMLCSIFHLKV